MSRFRSDRPFPSLAVSLFLFALSLTVLSACSARYPPVYARPASQPTAACTSTAEQSAEVPAQRTITIATLNMLHGWPGFEYLEQRKALVLAELQRLSPDVILLQEVPVLWRRKSQIGPWLAQSLGYSFVYTRANGRAGWIGFEEGEVVLSRFPIREYQRHVLSPKPGLFENRIVLRVVLDTPLGTLEVYNTHLSHRVSRDPLRCRQVQDLIRFVRQTHRQLELPAVVGGDFNSIPDSQPKKLLQSEGFVDIALQVDPPQVGPTAWLDDIRDPADSPRARIDYLFLYSETGARALSVLRCTRFLNRPFPTPTGPLWASDHVGVLCELALD
jgi:endonuclease/exonuclease/phosphatase family metal-dependent hydrolase